MMKKTSVLPLGTVFGWFISACLLGGCGSQPQPSTLAKSSQEKYVAIATLQGLVTDDSGPLKTGIVRALRDSGEVLASVELKDSPRYSLEIPAGTQLPILLAYYPSAGASDDQRMIAAAVHANASKYDINPSSTRIAKQAKALGGYTHNNLVRAAESTGIVPADNKTTAGFRGDPTKQYGGWH